MTNPIQRTHNLGQVVWLDYIRRGMFESGEFQQYIDLGISGVTSNPTIFEKAIVGSTDYDAALSSGSWAGKDIETIYETIAIEDIQTAADLLRPLYDKTDGQHGYVSFEVSPLLAYNTEGTINQARRLFRALNRPNVMVKVPATKEGIGAIQQLISEGINVNVTLLFSLEMYRQVREAYLSGLEKLATGGNHISRVASVASFFLSRVDSTADGLLEKQIKRGKKKTSKLIG